MVTQGEGYSHLLTFHLLNCFMKHMNNSHTQNLIMQLLGLRVLFKSRPVKCNGSK